MGDDTKQLENVSADELRSMINNGELSVDDLREPVETGERGEEVVEEPEGNNQPEPEETSVQPSKSVSSSDDYSFSIDVSKYPSGGIVYDFDEIRARGFKTSELKDLDLLNSSGSLREYHSRLFRVLQSTTNIDVKELTYGDELSLYLDLRANTFPRGDQFPLRFKCSANDCGEENIDYRYDLNQLDYKELDESYSDPKIYEVNGKTLKFRILRVRDVLDVESFLERYQKDDIGQELDFTPREIYQQCIRCVAIQDVEGEDVIEDYSRLPLKRRLEEVLKRVKLVSNDRLSLEQFNALRAFEKKYSHDIDLNITVECMHCGHEQPDVIPLSRKFFYPDTTVDEDSLDKYEKNG